MAQWKVYEVEDLVTKTGKPYKKCVLKDANNEQANNEPRVAVWDNHPEFAKIVVGATVNGILEKKDSGTPIPAHPEKNYVNRTLLADTGTQPMQMGCNCEARLAVIEKKLEITPSATDEISEDVIPF